MGKVSASMYRRACPKDSILRWEEVGGFKTATENMGRVSASMHRKTYQIGSMARGEGV